MKINVLESEVEEVVEQMFILKHEKLPYELKKYVHYIRQFNLGDYGKIDMITYSIKSIKTNEGSRDIHLDICIIELKKEDININTFTQAMRYKKGVLEYLDYLGDKFERDTFIYSNIEIILIGKYIDSNHESLCYYSDIINDISFYTYKVDVDGFYFNKETGYSLTDNKFSRNYNDIYKSLKAGKFRFKKKTF